MINLLVSNGPGCEVDHKMVLIWFKSAPEPPECVCTELCVLYHKLTKHPHITGRGEASEVDGFWGHPLDRQPSDRRCKEMRDVLWSTFFMFPFFMLFTSLSILTRIHV